MGHPLGSFIQNLLSHSTNGEILQGHNISLVVDNARMALDNPKNLALRKRFSPEQHQQHEDQTRRISHQQEVTADFRPASTASRKNSLDVSDHARGESRWESATTVSSINGSSVPVTPSRRERHAVTTTSGIRNHRERNTTNDVSSASLLVVDPSSTVVVVKQLSPVVEEHRKNRRSLVSNHPYHREKKLPQAAGTNLLDLQNPSRRQRRGHVRRSTNPKRESARPTSRIADSKEQRNTPDMHSTVYRLDEALAICSRSR